MKNHNTPAIIPFARQNQTSACTPIIEPDLAAPNAPDEDSGLPGLALFAANRAASFHLA